MPGFYVESSNCAGFPIRILNYVFFTVFSIKMDKNFVTYMQKLRFIGPSAGRILAASIAQSAKI